jgi:hypothetical protein
LHQSTRLAANAGGNFVDATDKAVQRKALQNTLAPCSSKLKVVVKKRDILAKDKAPLTAADLRKMIAAAGLDAGAPATGATPARVVGDNHKGPLNNRGKST